MKAILFLLSTTLCFIAKAQENEIDLHFNKNVELLGYIVELGDPSDNDPNHPISIEINKWPEDKNNPILFKIFEIAANMEYGMLIHLLYSLPEFPLKENYKLPTEVLKEHGYESEVEIDKIKTLIEKVNLFYSQTKFDDLWTNLSPYREETLKLLNERKPTESLITEIESFYEKSYEHYEIVPSLTIWSGPGWGIKNDETKTAIFVLGPLNKNYDFSDERFQNLSIHEFGHSFVNDVVLLNKDLINETEKLFTPTIKDSMSPQGYNNWQTCVIEHFVRAGEIIIPELMGDASQSKSLMKYHTEDKQFVYLPYIVEQLTHYRVDKKFTYKKSVRKTIEDMKEKFK